MSDIDIKVDDRVVAAALKQLEPRENQKLILAGERAAAKWLKPRIKNLIPKGPTGNLRKSLSQFTARREKPGAGVRLRPKIAPHRHLVIQGTRRRSTHGGANRGVMPANPFIGKAADEFGDAALDVAMAEIAKKIGL